LIILWGLSLLRSKSNKTEDPITLVDRVFSRLEFLEDNLNELFRESGKHRGIHMNVQTALDDVYDILRELRKTIYENGC